MAKQTSTSTTSIGKMSTEERRILQMQAERASQISGQFGDLSSLAAGDLAALGPEVERAILEAQAASRIGIQRRFEENQREGQLDASARGIAGSSVEAIESALGRQTRSDQFAELDSEAARIRLERPLQLAQLQLQTNATLGQMFQGVTASPLSALSNERLGANTTKTTQTGGFFQTALGLASDFASGGAFGAGGRFGKDG